MVMFTEKVRRLDRIRLALKRRFGDPPRLVVTHPVEHAIRTILAEEATAAQVEDAMARLRGHFVDWNDLRVSRPREVRDALGPDFPRSGQKARVIPRLLDQVFKQHNSMVWDFLEAMGKVQARAYFEKLEEVRPFVAAALARDCVGAHAFPVDGDAARVLGRLGILAPEAESETEMQGFLERAVKAGRIYEVHWLIKRLAEDFCGVGVPLCARCPLRKTCPSVVIPARTKAPKKGKKAARGKAAKPAGRSAAKTGSRAKAAAKAKGAARKKSARRRRR